MVAALVGPLAMAGALGEELEVAQVVAQEAVAQVVASYQPLVVALVVALEVAQVVAQEGVVQVVASYQL